jgi:hypothetical protein
MEMALGIQLSAAIQALIQGKTAPTGMTAAKIDTTGMKPMSGGVVGGLPPAKTVEVGSIDFHGQMTADTVDIAGMKPMSGHFGGGGAGTIRHGHDAVQLSEQALQHLHP